MIWGLEVGAERLDEARRMSCGVAVRARWAPQEFWRACMLHGRVQKVHVFVPSSFLRGLSTGLLFFCSVFVARVPRGRTSDKSLKLWIFPKCVAFVPKRIGIRQPGARRAPEGRNLHVSGPKLRAFLKSSTVGRQPACAAFPKRADPGCTTIAMGCPPDV